MNVVSPSGGFFHHAIVSTHSRLAYTDTRELRLVTVSVSLSLSGCGCRVNPSPNYVGCRVPKCFLRYGCACFGMPCAVYGARENEWEREGRGEEEEEGRIDASPV